MLLLALYKELCPVLWALHGCRRTEAGVVAATRTETETAVGAETGLLHTD